MLKTQNLYTQYTDLQLFELTRKDNTQAFDELYKRYRAPMINAAYKRLQSLQKAEDIVQDVFMTIYRRRYTIELNVSFSAYAYKALKFSVLNEIRSMLVREKYNQALFFTDVCKNDFSERIDAKQLNAQIHQTLNSLPEKCRKAFILSRDHSLPYKQISADLNISVSTVEKHIVKALKIMRTSIGEYRVG